MPAFSHITTVLPEHRVRLGELDAIGAEWLGEDARTCDRFKRICASSGVKNRHFVLPHSEILALNGMAHRAAQFELHGTEMLTRAIEAALDINSQNPEDIGALVFSSCSVPMIPSIDAAAILKSSLPNTVARVPVYQHGCAGGVTGLALGAKLAALGKPVLVSSVELCSLVCQPQNHSGAQLVAAAIFGDGAAATILSPEKGHVSIRGSQSYLIPGSRHLMGYDIFDDGFHLRLDRSLPGMLIDQAPAMLNQFLKEHEKEPADIDYWLFHPGGIKILNLLKAAFSLSDDQCSWSYAVLRDTGNLSSATIFFVINEFLKEDLLQPGETALVMGIGPGLTIETLLLEG